MKIKHILLIEVLIGGHRSKWLKNISSIFLKDGNRVTIAILEDFVRPKNPSIDNTLSSIDNTSLRQIRHNFFQMFDFGK